MASRSIQVAVEGEYATLHMAGRGLPLPLCMQLQTSRLNLCDADWTAKSSADGFSVTLFWPRTSSKPAIDEKKQKRRKKKKIASTPVVGRRSKRPKISPSTSSGSESTPSVCTSDSESDCS